MPKEKLDWGSLKFELSFDKAADSLSKSKARSKIFLALYFLHNEAGFSTASTSQIAKVTKTMIRQHVNQTLEDLANRGVIKKINRKNTVLWGVTEFFTKKYWLIAKKKLNGAN